MKNTQSLDTRNEFVPTINKRMGIIITRYHFPMGLESIRRNVNTQFCQVYGGMRDGQYIYIYFLAAATMGSQHYCSLTGDQTHASTVTRAASETMWDP